MNKINDKMNDSWKKYLPAPKKLIQASKESVIKYGANNVLFGILCCINFTVPYFIWNHESPIILKHITTLRLIGAIMAGLLIVKNQWNEKIKSYFPIIWYLSLLYCLAFLIPLMFFISHEFTGWLINIFLSVFFLIILVDLTAFFIIVPIGIGLAILYHNIFIGPIIFNKIGFINKFLLIYQLIFGIGVGLIAIYRRKKFFIIKQNQSLEVGLSMCSELRNLGIHLTPQSQITEIFLNRAKKNPIKDSENKEGYLIYKEDLNDALKNNKLINNYANNLLQSIKDFKDLFQEFKESIANPKTFSLKKILESIVDEINRNEKIKILVKQIGDIKVKIPPKSFKYILINLIKRAIKANATSIEIWTENNKLHLKDNGKGITEDDISKIFYSIFSISENYNEHKEILITKQIIENYYGELWCDSKTGEGSYTEIVLNFPLI